MFLPRSGDARLEAIEENVDTSCGNTRRRQMTVAQFEALAPTLATELLRARFEALAEWGMPFEDARTIASRLEVDIVDVARLLQRGCPPKLALELLL
jgi:hypothetical protein